MNNIITHRSELATAPPQDIAACFYALRGKKVRQSMSKKVEEGIIPGCAPVGYKNIVVEGKRGIVPDPEAAPLVREAFGLAAWGATCEKFFAS